MFLNLHSGIEIVGLATPLSIQWSQTSFRATVRGLFEAGFHMVVKVVKIESRSYSSAEVQILELKKWKYAE
jgi:hypothetical protein